LDAQRAAGRWPGSTWHPRRLARLRFGLLRIDHVFAGPGVKPVVVRVDRNARGSDHHAITATFELRPGAGPQLSA
jgi:endonuclease/exonuclease/phosphatase (EEP) superfamily protein YafD